MFCWILILQRQSKSTLTTDMLSDIKIGIIMVSSEKRNRIGLLLKSHIMDQLVFIISFAYCCIISLASLTWEINLS